MKRPRSDRRQRTLPPTSPVDGFATIKDLMGYFRLSQNKVRALLDDEANGFEVRRIGRAVRITWRSVRRFTGDEPLIASPITEEDAALIARMLLSIAGQDSKRRNR